jgi:hypothetical protein
MTRPTVSAVISSQHPHQASITAVARLTPHDRSSAVADRRGLGWLQGGDLYKPFALSPLTNP